MSDRTSDSCGPFWLLERICRLIASRNGVGFNLRFLMDDWFEGMFFRPTLAVAIKMLREFRSYRSCHGVSRLHFKLMFFTFRENTQEASNPWEFERVLEEYVVAHSLATHLYWRALSNDEVPDQYTHVFVDTWLRLEPALQLLEYLRSCDLGSFGERVELRMMIEVAPWRDSSSDENEGLRHLAI